MDVSTRQLMQKQDGNDMRFRHKIENEDFGSRHYIDTCSACMWRRDETRLLGMLLHSVRNADFFFLSPGDAVIRRVP